jgi:hypothetical protein
MPHASDPSNDPLAQLEAAKNRFEPGHAVVVAKLLAKVSRLQIDDPRRLIRFHEVLLFLRAFPHAPSQISRVERLLNTLYRRVEKLSSFCADMSAFDDFDTSGIAGTTMQDTLSFDVAQWLAQRIPGSVEIAWKDYWDDYQSERARGNTWPRFIPLLEEDGDVEANIPWRRWIDTARAHKQALPWLLGCFAKLPVTPRQQAELYDSLRLPIRWKLENLKLSRTRNWARPRRFHFHDRPLIQRNEVSLFDEFARPNPRLEKLAAAAGISVLQTIKEVMVVRYRELYGTTLGDPRSVVRIQLGRGVTMHFWGLPADRRLPLRAYLAGYTEKNGVPINYIEAIGLCEWIEVGFNTFYTYRQGETAWIYAQALRCLRALTGAKCFSVYPYQIGQNNDEAIDSGAFWFYRKLGFRCGRVDLRTLCQREERKIASDPKYRSSRRTLKRLAEAHMFYELPASGALEHAYGAWDRFSVRSLGLLVNRRMSQEFDGDSEKIRTASVAAVTQALNVDSVHWIPLQKQALENWSLVLAAMPGLSRWPAQEKQKLVEMIRAKSGSNEMKYLRLTQRHSRFRKELLGLGSNFKQIVSVRTR